MPSTPSRTAQFQLLVGTLTDVAVDALRNRRARALITGPGHNDVEREMSDYVETLRRAANDSTFARRNNSLERQE